MDYTELLPPLPEREFIAIGGPPMIQFGPYEADEMRAYALAAIAAAAPAIRRAERERCATACEIMRDRTLGTQGGNPHELVNIMLRQVAELGWSRAAIEIRALPDV